VRTGVSWGGDVAADERAVAVVLCGQDTVLGIFFGEYLPFKLESEIAGSGGWVEATHEQDSRHVDESETSEFVSMSCFPVFIVCGNKRRGD
jgi:hypothetical protein